MKRLILSACLATLFGCGGSGSSSNSAETGDTSGENLSTGEDAGESDNSNRQALLGTWVACLNISDFSEEVRDDDGFLSQSMSQTYNADGSFIGLVSVYESSDCQGEATSLVPTENTYDVVGTVISNQGLSVFEVLSETVFGPFTTYHHVDGDTLYDGFSLDQGISVDVAFNLQYVRQ